jgi:hippurate hydrolase
MLSAINDINEGIARANNLPKALYPQIKMKSNVYPLINNDNLQIKINKSLSKVLNPANIISNVPAVMVSEDFQNLVSKDSKTVYDYIFVGVANQNLVDKTKDKNDEKEEIKPLFETL